MQSLFNWRLLALLLASMLPVFATGCTAKSEPAAGAESAEEEEAEPAPVKTAQLEEGSLPLTIRAIGTIAPLRQQATVVRSRVAGVIGAIKVHDGDAITSGVELISLDGRAARSQLARAQSALDLAQRERQFARQSSSDQQQAELDLAAQQAAALADQTAREAERQKSLLEKGLTAQKGSIEAEQAALAAKQAAAASKSKADAYRGQGRRIEMQRLDAAFAEAEANLTQAKIDADFQTIRAALDGRVSRIIAAAGQTINPGDPLIEIDPSSGVGVQFALTPEDADRIHPGMEFLLGGDGRFKGRILSVGAGVVAETGLVPVEGSLDPGTDRPYLGQALVGGIVIGQSEKGLIAPLSALLVEEEKSFIAIVNEEDESEKIEVKVLARQGNRVAVSSKQLSSGMTVISDGAYNLPDKTPVEDLSASETKDKTAKQETP